MNTLVLNAGSSSIKYSLFDMARQHEQISGLIERIGETESLHKYAINDNSHSQSQAIADHQQALSCVFATLAATGLISPDRPLAAIGHRVVHGGEYFSQPSVITTEVIANIAATIPLAPLHNPANLLGIDVALAQMPQVPQVAIFDTAFHSTLPAYAYRYPLPASWHSEHGVRRYGFHGTSHGYVAKQAAAYLNRPLETTNLITLHLGNGASIAAIENGRSIDTSMGMTPLEGLMMGTRCGDIDPAIIFYLSRTLGWTNDTIEAQLNKQSGCKGICGENDMRTVHHMANTGDSNAQLALAMYAYRLKKYIGSYMAVLGRVDALVFTGGIGENDAWLRQQCLQSLTAFGITLDNNKNQSPTRPIAAIHTDDAPVKLLVITTNEALEIAQQTVACLGLV